MFPIPQFDSGTSSLDSFGINHETCVISDENAANEIVDRYKLIRFSIDVYKVLSVEEKSIGFLNVFFEDIPLWGYHGNIEIVKDSFIKLLNESGYEITALYANTYNLDLRLPPILLRKMVLGVFITRVLGQVREWMPEVVELGLISPREVINYEIVINNPVK